MVVLGGGGGSYERGTPVARTLNPKPAFNPKPSTQSPTPYALNRCRANIANIRQSRPDSGLGFQVKVRATFQCAPFSLESGTWYVSLALSLSHSLSLPHTHTLSLTHTHTHSLSLSAGPGTHRRQHAAASRSLRGRPRCARGRKNLLNRSTLRFKWTLRTRARVSTPRLAPREKFQRMVSRYKVRCWRWLFGYKIPVSTTSTYSAVWYLKYI